jgi:type IV pilus assembly protein PilC
MAIRLSNQEKLELISNLGTMLKAGIPILEALETLEEDAKGNLKKALDITLKDIREGKQLADSFEQMLDAFDPVTVNLLRSAEESGNLDVMLKDIKDNIKKSIEFNSKIMSALTYPALVFILFIGIFIMILTYVVPRVAEVFSKLNVILPLPTRIMIWASTVFINYWYVFAVAAVLLIASGIALYTVKKRSFVNILLSLPLISKLGKEIDLAKFSQAMGFLLGSGIAITKAMEYSEHVVGRKAAAEAIRQAQKSVLEGGTLADGLGSSPDVFPKTMTRIVSAGEKSGSLENSMTELSNQYEERVSNTLKTITTLIEPLLLVVIGFLVGGIMLAIIAPIYQMIGTIAPR